MNENGNRYALAALRERRAALDSEIKECDRKLRYLREAIGHIDATLSLFDPNGDPKEIAAKRPYKRVKLFASVKLSRLRRGARPMTTSEIIASVVEKMGYGPEPPRACRTACGRTCSIRAKSLGGSKRKGSGKPPNGRL